MPYVFTVFVLSARFYVRAARRAVGTDDWLMLAGWILYTAALGLSTALVMRGSTRHIMYISLTDQLWILKVQNVSQPFGATAVCLAKASVASLLLRIMDKTTVWRRWYLYVSIALYVAMLIVADVLVFMQCNPPRALWNPQLIQEALATCPLVKVNTDFTILYSGKLLFVEHEDVINSKLTNRLNFRRLHGLCTCFVACHYHLRTEHINAKASRTVCPSGSRYIRRSLRLHQDAPIHRRIRLQ